MENQYIEIERKYESLINMAIEKMKCLNDPKHSLVHVLDVVEYTKEILETEHRANKEVCIISAYWHDVGRIQQNKGHGLISANELRAEMEKQNYPQEFIEECYKAIYKHEWREEPETLEGIIIRDADKLDNYRVKSVDSLEAHFDLPKETIQKEKVSENVLQAVRDHRCVRREERKTHLDMWVSYLAFIFDLNFPSSFRFIQGHDYINRCIDRMDYHGQSTREAMEEVRRICLDYVQEKAEV